jgi:methionine-rich copper-binding protein CopC
MKRARSALAIAVTAAVVGLASPAFAHAKVVSTSPGNGQTVQGDVKTVSVLFDDVVTLVPHALVVTTDLGIPVSLESPRIIHGKTLEAFVQDHLAAGHYVVAWRIQADDGHIESSSFGFTVAGAAAPTSGHRAASPTAPPSPGEPIWPVLVAAAIALAAGTGAGVAVRRGLRIAAAGDIAAVHVTQNPDEYFVSNTPKPPLRDV